MAATIYEPLSTAHLKSCIVDFDSRPDKKAVNLVQYDQTIPVLCVSLKKGGTEYKVPSDADVNIRMDKRDGYHVYNPALGVNAERTIAYFAVTPQMSTGWGDYYPIVEITVGGGVAGSAPIWLHFDRNPLPENAIISSDEYKTIQQLLEDVTAVKAATEQIKAQTEAVRDQAKEFADNAKNSADKAQTLVDGMPSDYSQAMKDIGTLKNQMQRAYPDDSAIGENPWSSKNIVDMLCPPIEESGNPAVCYPVAGYPLGVKAKWEPMQEGSGDPSPENIRPIKGRESVRVERCGENLIKYPAVSSLQGIELSVDDNKLTIKGTCSDRVIFKSDDIYLPDDTYTLSSDVLIPKGVYISAYTTIEKLLLNYNRRTVTGKVSGNTRMLIYLEAGTYNFTVQVSLVSGTTAPTTYTPFIGQTNTLTLPETVYGGSVDAKTGEGQKPWGMLTLDGTEDWIAPSTNTYYAFFGNAAASKHIYGYCSHLPYVDDASKKCVFVNANGAVVIFGYNADYTLADFKTYIAAQYAAGTPVQVCYKLAEPVPFTATGAQPIPALAGVNTVLTDADSATVTGRADPIKRIEDLEAAVASIN